MLETIVSKMRRWVGGDASFAGAASPLNHPRWTGPASPTQRMMDELKGQLDSCYEEHDMDKPGVNPQMDMMKKKWK